MRPVHRLSSIRSSLFTTNFHHLTTILGSAELLPAASPHHQSLPQTPTHPQGEHLYLPPVPTNLPTTPNLLVPPASIHLRAECLCLPPILTQDRVCELSPPCTSMRGKGVKRSHHIYRTGEGADEDDKVLRKNRCVECAVVSEIRCLYHIIIGQTIKESQQEEKAATATEGS